MTDDSKINIIKRKLFNLLLLVLATILSIALLETWAQQTGLTIWLLETPATLPHNLRLPPPEETLLINYFDK